MNLFRINFLFFYLLYLHEVNGFISYIGRGLNYMKCSLQECCDEYYINQDIKELNRELDRKLFGQHIAHEIVISALTAHINIKEPKKALAMSFHGPTGTGKNFVANMLMNTFYMKNQSSKFVHLFSGRMSFALSKDLERYKDYLRLTIINSLQSCPQSLFIFDEVDMIVPGVLNVLVPFLDYGTTQQIWFIDEKVRVTTNRAIFIFISNTGSQKIVTRLLDFWYKGKSRIETKLVDFEDLISKGAFNELGGFHKSHTIHSNLIDHYVPFLPLEKEHVLRCIVEDFESKGYTPTDEQIDTIMEYVTFDPSTNNLYAKGGCKRIDSKVSSLIYRRKSRSEL